MTTHSDSYPGYPSFRRFIVDVETMLPIKIETYAIDITQDDPVFEFRHELTEYYAIKDLSPHSFDTLSERFKDDETLAIKYLKTKN